MEFIAITLDQIMSKRMFFAFQVSRGKSPVSGLLLAAQQQA
jgi:hypothetical protein